MGVSESKIQGGYGDGSDLGVIGLAVTDAKGYLSRTCSGTLLAPNLVLTAQHCVASTAKYVNCGDAAFGVPVDAPQVFVTTSANMWAKDTTWLPVAKISVAPGAPAVCGRDVALLVLSEPIDASIKPIEPRIDEQVNGFEKYSAVGYGASDGDGDGAGIRRRRDALEVMCVGPTCSSTDVDGREWRGDHGVCDGDSGGPAIDEQGRVIGVTSRGPSGCDDPIYGGLVSHRDWIVAEAVKAADFGGLDVPSWAGLARATSAHNSVSLDPTARYQSCSTSSPGGRSGAGVFALALAFAAQRLAARRKARAEKRG